MPVNSISQYLNYNDPSLAMMSQEDINNFQRENEISLKGHNLPKPILSFRALKLPSFIQHALNDEKYEKPTAIQSQCWPIAFEGKNLVGIAQTGSGKTFGFILPCLLNLAARGRGGDSFNRGSSPQVLVLAPTRELAQQTHQVATKFGGREVRSVCVYGGAPKYIQRQELRRGVDICIATPGRLNDFLESREVNLKNCSFLVLDEADRMLDMGFEPQVRKIIGQMGTRCQTMMFSATWPKSVQRLAEEFLGDYVQVNIGAINNSATANHSITQIVEVCKENDKLDRFFKIMDNIYNQGKENKTIIFAETKKKVDYLAKEMQKERYKVVAIHGDKSQQDRDWILKSFSTGRFNMMVATDVASRGLDVDDIKYVINYDYPNSSEDYVHRIGRTGRRGKTGTAYTFMTQNNSRHAKELVGVLKEANQEVGQELEQMAQRGGGGYGGGGRYGGGNRGYGGGNRGYGGGNRSNGGGSNGGSNGGSRHRRFD